MRKWHKNSYVRNNDQLAVDGPPPDVAAAEAFGPIDFVNSLIGAGLRVGDIVS